MLQGTKHFQTEQKTPALQSAESEILTEIFAYVLANFIKTQKKNPSIKPSTPILEFSQGLPAHFLHPTLHVMEEENKKAIMLLKRKKKK